MSPFPTAIRRAAARVPAALLALGASLPAPAQSLAEAQALIVRGRIDDGVRIYRQAAERGDAAAQNNLGALYFDGDAVAKDEAQAVAWFARSAAQGDAKAQFNLGTLYRSGRGVPQNDAQAAAWFARAADQGFAPAQFNLGVLYDNGLGVQRDSRRAVALVRQAAAQGLEPARALLKQSGLER